MINGIGISISQSKELKAFVQSLKFGYPISFILLLILLAVMTETMIWYTIPYAIFINDYIGLFGSSKTGFAGSINQWFQEILNLVDMNWLGGERSIMSKNHSTEL